ncbi:YihY/virulence factor BrkB family protein [soil metagenome]
MKDRAHKYLKESRHYNRFVEYLKSSHLGKGEISLYSLANIFIEKVHKDDIFERANGVAFNFTLAIFPAIIFLFTLIPYLSNFIAISHVDLQLEIMAFMEEIMPDNMYETAASTIYDIISIQRGGLLTFGFFFAIFMATNGMLSLMHSFNRCYKTNEKRGFIKTRLMATILTIILSLILITAVVILGVGQLALHYMESFLAENYILYLFILLRYAIVFLIFYVGISLIYHYAPAIHTRWRFFSIGSLLATTLCILISFGFSYYITTFATYNRIYGSIGALMGLMIWFYLISIALLLGFELNASIDKAKAQVLQKQVV